MSKASLLKRIKRTKDESPDRIVIYGDEGVGKTTFAAEAPDPVFIAPEVRFRNLEVNVFPKPESWNEILEQVEALDSEHGYKTAVLDTLDATEALLFRELCRKNGWASIGEPGWQNGEKAAVDDWRILLSALDRLRERRGMQVILTGHGRNGKFKAAHAEVDWNRWTINIDERAVSLISGWADTILFAQFETFAQVGRRGAKTRGTSSGRRVCRTQYDAAWVAKNTYSLPPAIPLRWSEYATLRDGRGVDRSDELVAEIWSLLEQLPEAMREERKPKLEAWLDQKPTQGQLAKTLDMLRTLVHEHGVPSDTPEETPQEEGAE